MANPLPNEKEIYDEIQNEHIVLHPQIWDLIYKVVGDNITSINLLVAYYNDSDWSMPKLDCEKVINCVDDIGVTVRKICDPTKMEEGDEFYELKEEIENVSPLIKDLLSHNVGNDCHAIGFIAADAKDDGFASSYHQDRILTLTNNLTEFLDKLRKITYLEENN